MPVLFCLGLLAYYAAFLRKRRGESSELALLLWWTYLALGCSSLIIELTGLLQPVFNPNYLAVLFLLACILLGIASFQGFRSRAVADVIVTIRGQDLIEAVLIGLQTYSIVFFLPFAIGSLSGDVGANRLELSSQQDILASYGFYNTVAGMGGQLFGNSLVMACIRICQPKGRGRSLPRAAVLVLASLSYVIYILAYVGRDGSIYWLMTALLVFLIFRKHMPDGVRRKLVVVGLSLCGLVLAPMILITVGRFANSDYGVGASLLEYFGAQIHHFSDFGSIDRPKTFGAQSFPLFWPAYCSVVGNIGCADWEVLRPFIFDIYLSQGKTPWVFGTYVSDFVADFGYEFAAGLLIIFAFLCHWACVGRDYRGMMSAPRLLWILFLFLTPYWGVFYFRFGIMNGFLLINILFIGFVWGVQSYLTPAVRSGVAASYDKGGKVLRGGSPTLP